MPDTQQLLDRGLSTSQIRQMCGNFRALAPKARTHLTTAVLLAAPKLDACNHA
jgi:hypothetical protein